MNRSCTGRNWLCDQSRFGRAGQTLLPAWPEKAWCKLLYDVSASYMSLLFGCQECICTSKSVSLEEICSIFLVQHFANVSAENAPGVQGWSRRLADLLSAC